MSVSNISAANRPQAGAVQPRRPAAKEGKDFASILDNASKNSAPQAAATAATATPTAAVPASTAASAPVARDNV